MMKTLTTAVVASLIATTAYAAPVLTPQEIVAGNLIGIGLYADATCSLTANPVMLEAFLAQEGFPNSSWSKNPKVVAQVIASQRGYAKNPDAQFCAELEAQYGKDGTVARGFLLPK